MNHYEGLIELIREAGGHNNPPMLQIGIYKDKNIEISGEKIPLKYFLISSSLITDDTEYWTFRSNSREGPLRKDERCVLKNGDKVLVYQLSESELLLLDKVVRL